jgi:2-oxoisovalerate dehydrogenase E1 component
VHAATETALARARAGEGPTLLECKTYRTRAHAEGMGDFTYRSRGEVEAWRARDPIGRYAQHLIDNLLADPADLEAIDACVVASIADARRFAESSPWPDPASAATHIYFQNESKTPASPALRCKQEEETN